MHNKNGVSSVTLLTLVLLLLISLSLQSLVNYEIGQIGRNLIGKAINIDSGQVNLCVNNQPTIDISNCADSVTVDENYHCTITAEDQENASLIFV